MADLFDSSHSSAFLSTADSSHSNSVLPSFVAVEWNSQVVWRFRSIDLGATVHGRLIASWWVESTRRACLHLGSGCLLARLSYVPSHRKALRPARNLGYLTASQLACCTAHCTTASFGQASRAWLLYRITIHCNESIYVPNNDQPTHILARRSSTITRPLDDIIHTARSPTSRGPRNGCFAA